MEETITKEIVSEYCCLVNPGEKKDFAKLPPFDSQSTRNEKEINVRNHDQGYYI